MAVTIAAAAAALPISGKFVSDTGDEAIKRTLIDGAASDTDVTNFVDDLDHISNAQMVDWKFGGRIISGMKGAPVTALQNLVSTWLQLNYTQVDPVNSANTIERHFSVPAFVDSIRGSDNTVTIAAAGTGSLAARVGRINEFLIANLAFTAADGSIVSGGWTFAGSGFGTGADVIDGE